MKNENPIRDAIDESLSGVRFNAQDARSVLRAVRIREEEPAPRPRPRMRFDMVFACAMLLILVVPLSLFALRAQTARTKRIVAGPGGTTAAPLTTVSPQEDRITVTAAPARSSEESEAIRIARACFEAQCDTSVFAFEEYAVSVAAAAEGESTIYTVDMTCIYGNGCRFTVVVALPAGEIMRYSTPALATVPTFLDSSAPEIQAWYAKYGPYLFTWPAEDQVEFSRRYEGGTLRLAREGELSFEDAKAFALKALAEATGYDESPSLYAYPVLYSENDATGKAASYVVYCCKEPVTDALPAEGFAAVVTFSVTGEDVDIQLDSL